MIDTHTGRGAAWLARLTGGQEVGGSNPLAPINPKRWFWSWRTASSSKLYQNARPFLATGSISIQCRSCRRNVRRRTLWLMKSRGMKVMVTGGPHLPQYTGERSANPHDILAQTVAEEQVAYLNSYAAIQQAAGGLEISELYRPLAPTHFNIAGHEVVGPRPG